MTLFDFALIVLAAGGLVDLLLHGSIFAGFRARMEACNDWRSMLFSCPYCLTFQATFWLSPLMAMAVAASMFELPALALALKLPFYFFAAARVAWLTDAYLPEAARYTRPGL